MLPSVPVTLVLSKCSKHHNDLGVQHTDHHQPLKWIPAQVAPTFS
jgi:hypothetical protein